MSIAYMKALGKLVAAMGWGVNQFNAASVGAEAPDTSYLDELIKYDGVGIVLSYIVVSESGISMKIPAATGLFGRRVAPNILKNQIYEAMKTEGASYLVRHVQESEAGKAVAYQIATFTAEQKTQLNLESPALGS